MSNLPKKQSAFSKIRNNVLDASLRNSFTRKIVVNFFPQAFGYSIIKHVKENDNENLDQTIQLLASMNKSALIANFNNFTNISRYLNNGQSENTTNRILDALSPKMQTVFAMEFIKREGTISSSFGLSNDVLKRIVDAAHLDTVDTREVSNLLKPFYTREIPFYAFSSLTPEQKKSVFADIIKDFPTEYGDMNLNNVFSQLRPEDRLEQFDKILEFYQSKLQETTNLEFNGIEPDLDLISSCFGFLSEEERSAKLEDVLKILTTGKNQENNGMAIATLLKNLTVQEQEKYCVDLFKYVGKSEDTLSRYVYAVDESLHGLIIPDVIAKLRELNPNFVTNGDYSYKLEDILSRLNPIDRNNFFLDILSNRDINSPDIPFILKVLSRPEGRFRISEDFIKTMSEGDTQFITPERFDSLVNQGYNVNSILELYVQKRCEAVVAEFTRDPNPDSYANAIQQISDIAGSTIHEVEDTSSSYTKKMQSILSLYRTLEPDKREDYLNLTLDNMLTIRQNKYIDSHEAQDILSSLDKKFLVDHFVDFMSQDKKTQSSVSVALLNLFTDFSEESQEKIYSQYLDLFSKDTGSEEFDKAIVLTASYDLEQWFLNRLSKDNEHTFLTEDALNQAITTCIQKGYGNSSRLTELFIQSRLNKIIDSYNETKDVDEALRALSQRYNIDNYGSNLQVANSQLDTITRLFGSLSKEERGDHFDRLYEALGNFKENVVIENRGFLEIFPLLSKEEQLERFPGFVEHMSSNLEHFSILFDKLENDDKVKIFENYIMNLPNRIDVIAKILSKYDAKKLNEIFKGKTLLDDETIKVLIEKDKDLATKVLLFDKDVDRERISELATYSQLQKNAIDINSIVRNLYFRNPDKDKEEFNRRLRSAYNLLTYNNVPDFMKNFRLYQLGSYSNVENPSLMSFQGKTKQERDALILEDLFKISLDSNNESLRDFCNIIIEGKRLTILLQSNPEENVKTLSQEELAVLSQYRDTLFDLHNFTKEIRETDRPMLDKSDDIISDLRRLNSVYANRQDPNYSSRNIVFNPNRIMDELFGSFITTSIRPQAMLDYMDKKQQESDLRHIEIERKLRDGSLRVEPGDFVKGISYFDDYVLSMFNDGIKGGEFNQEFSHSDLTPLDCDFGYVSRENLKGNPATDFATLSTTVSIGYSNILIVLKNYAERLKDRSRESFDLGTFTGMPDYYPTEFNQESPANCVYVRTGIPITDVDYLVVGEWNYKNSYEIAMSGKFIPVVDRDGNIVFSYEDYTKIREEMRGLSRYNCDDFIVDPSARNVEALYAIYREVSSKSKEEVEEELEAVRGLIDEKPDTVTSRKKEAVVKLIKEFFLSKGIKVADDLSQNLSSDSVELIDTGSTGRMTNIPGDGDFDFMLRHNLPQEILTELRDKIAQMTPQDKEFADVGDGFRAKDVVLPDGDVADIDVTTAKKSLKLSYSSDICVRDRLNNIKETNPEMYRYVQANIIMAKKILKAKGIYKKVKSDGCTEHGGFGGIGVENWILQNGGSFEQAIKTFLEAAKSSKTYYEFQSKYPIFDFGFNQREGKVRHDVYSSFFTYDPQDPNVGYNYVVSVLGEMQKTLELQRQSQTELSPLVKSISTEGFAEASKKKLVLRKRFNFAKMRGMVAKFASVKEVEVKDGEEEKE